MDTKRCARCIMDNSSDDTITFDENGYCNYCTEALRQINTTVYFPNAEGQKKLDALLADIRASGQGKKYDCIMGISGGLDSSYLAMLGYQWGLRILLVHIDDGFDTEISKANLVKLVKSTGFDYQVIAPDKDQFCALTKAYMKAGVPNIAVPQDNVLFAFIYDLMRKERIRYFLSGGNFALECILQHGNTYKAFDVVNIKDINRRFGTLGLDKLKFISTNQVLYDKRVLNIQSPRPLNYIDYNREKAFKELYDFCGFEYYGRKHLENILTAFIQLYWFPKKFGVDKRTSHLSSMIVSGQLTREEALQKLSEPLYDDKTMERYIGIVKENIGLSDEEFDAVMAAQSHQHTEYRCEDQQIMNRLISAFSAIKHNIVK